MSLLITLPQRNIDGKKSPWEESGISEEDIELAKETGLIDNPDDLVEDDFKKMMDEQEDIIEQGLNFLDEIDLWYDKRPRAIEFLKNRKVYREVEVRVVSIMSNSAYGTIDGYPSVFIPHKFMESITLNEIYRMDLQYREEHSYPWIVVKIYPKVEPFVAAKIIGSGDDEYMKVHIPKQNIGQMIGKSGNNLKNILSTAKKVNPELNELWTDGINENRYSPKLNVHDNTNELYTEVDVWIPKSPVNKEVEWNVLEDYVQKIYS